jgi:hypothetical protein
MRRSILASLVLGLSLGLSLGHFVPTSLATEQASTTEKPDASTHRLVIQINQKDEALQDQVLSNIVNLQKHYGLDNIEIEVVAYGPGVWFLTEQSSYKQRIESLMLQNVVYTACGNTLESIEAKEGKRPALIEGVEFTQTGIARIIERQEQGWSYLSP